MDLTREWREFKRQLAFKKAMLMMEKYNEVVNEVDIPNFAKPIEDRLETQVINHIDRLEAENRLDEFINPK